MMGLLASVALLSSPPPDHLEWFRKARFGMFIHWGPVALRGTEIGWSRGDSVPNEEYDALYKRFNPTAFDANEWMRIAKRAGMKYVVPTAKHHDGFRLWPTATSDYQIMSTPFRRDIMGEIAAAARKQGLTMCSYYSILDWRSPDYGTGSPGGKGPKPNPNMPRHMATVETELTELIDRYGIKMVWFDGQWETPYTREDSVKLNAFLRAKAPNLVINDRIAWSGAAGDDPRGDYRTPEQHVGEYNVDRPWETCMTLGDQWAYRPNDRYKTPEQVLTILLQTVTGDGNLLLNVGPDETGRIPEAQQKLLASVGEWLKRYGKSVYDTRGGPYRNGEWGGTTRRGKTIYFHVLNWGNGDVDLPALPAKIRSTRVLQPDQTVEVSWSEKGFKLRRTSPPATGPTTIRVDIDADAWGLGTIG